jgi:predicted nucleotidyltransferase
VRVIETGDRLEVIRSIGRRLQAEGALGALVIGSVARGTATDSSDFDVLVVEREGSGRAAFERTLYGDVLAEIVSKDEHGWRAHLRSLRPRWVYAFRDGGEVLFDDDGCVARLQVLSETVYREFVTPDEVKQELATLLWHGRAKVERAASSTDPAESAYWAALLLPTLIDALLGLANRPTVPGSRRLEVLDSIALSEDDASLLTVTMLGAPHDRVRAARQLADSLLARLGDPDLKRVDW